MKLKRRKRRKTRVVRRQKSTRLLNSNRRDNRFGASISTRHVDRSLDNYQRRNYEHPYATRSKCIRAAQSSINVNENDNKKLKRRQSDSSIVCLGTYRKVPELVVLEEIADHCTEIVVKPKALVRLKEEQMDFHSSED